MNNMEKGMPPMEQPPKQSQPEKTIPAQNPNSDEMASRELEEKIQAAKKLDDSKIAEILASLGLEQANATNDVKQHLQEYLDLKEGAIERIGLMKAKDLPKNYQSQREVFHDERLDGVTIAVIPDDLWMKGKNQPSESNAEKQLVLFKQSYFEAQDNPDEIAWLCHELAHCQKFLDSESPAEYEGNMEKFAFEDLKTEYSYPNNPVEQFTFTKQFEYLKEQGKNRNDVLKMLGQNYSEEDFPFFNRLLDSVYK